MVKTVKMNDFVESCIRERFENENGYADAIPNGSVHLENFDFGKIRIQDLHLVDQTFINCNFSKVAFFDTTASRCKFINCNFYEADFGCNAFTDCDFSRSNFTNAMMTDCNFTGSVFYGATLPVEVPVVENLDLEIYEAIVAGLGNLSMSSWHSMSCNTTHCRAGWAIVLAGDEGWKLEDKVGAALAGTLIYAASSGAPIPNFYDNSKTALEDIAKRAGKSRSLAKLMEANTK